VAVGEPRYVSRIDPLSNTIQLGRREDLEVRSFVIERASFIDPVMPETTFRASVRVRHRATPVPATIERLGGASERRYLVHTDVPVWAAAPGQAAVLYDGATGDEVLGGGRIARPAVATDESADTARTPALSASA
jgi:tRNA-specific 2-thiouridylase